MDILDEKNYIFNIKLAKITRLYQILDPGTVKYKGRNVYHIIIAFFSLYVCATSVLFTLSVLYYWTVDMALSIDYTWKLENSIFVLYKIWLIVQHSDDIWNCLSITRYDFTSFSNRNRHIILDRWRDRVVLYTNLYAIVYITAATIFTLIPFAFSEDKLPVKSHDGSIGYYRLNIMNFYLIASDETYNAHYSMFVFAEGLCTCILVSTFIIFDILLVTLCVGICCQMQMISSAFESVGYKSPRDQNPPHGEYEF